MITEVFLRPLAFAFRVGVFAGLVVLTGCGGTSAPAPQESAAQPNPPRRLPVDEFAAPLPQSAEPLATAAVVPAASVTPESKPSELLATPWGAIGARDEVPPAAPEADSPPEPTEPPRAPVDAAPPAEQAALGPTIDPPVVDPPTHGAGILRRPIEEPVPSLAGQPGQEAALAEPPVPEPAPALAAEAATEVRNDAPTETAPAAPAESPTGPALSAAESPRPDPLDEPFMTGTLPGRSAPSWAPNPAPTSVQSATAAPPVALTPPAATAPRSREMEAVAQRADEHSQRGFELAGRRAYFSARAEFIQALRLLVQALDAQQHTQEHGQSLARALRALEESDSFVPRGSALESDLDVAAIVRSHRTEALKAAESAGLTPLVALQRYYSYAQEQLAAAVRPELAGSISLYGLGKLHAAQATNKGSSFSSGEAKAMVFHQAALLANPRNYMAANELGVLLARYGRLTEARAALVYSVSVSPQPATWHNLAVVHQQLGETQLAQQARQRAGAAGASQLAAPAAGSPGARPEVQWLDSSRFAQSVSATGGLAAPAGKAPSPPPATAGAEKKGVAGWIPWLENPTK